jgi:hypothetical protein
VASIQRQRQDERALIPGDLGAGLLVLCFRFDFRSLEMRIIQSGRDVHSGAAVMNITLQLALGLAAVWLGHLLGHAIARSGA